MINAFLKQEKAPVSGIPNRIAIALIYMDIITHPPFYNLAIFVT